jgi:hypothetical protein
MNGFEGMHLSPETIEDVALGRLPEDLKAGVSSHLDQCEECRKAVEKERLLAAGTKSWARAAMKKRLAENIRTATQRQVPWPRILSAAAVVVAIVGVGVFYNWRKTADEPRPLSETRTDTIVRPSGQTSTEISAGTSPVASSDVKSEGLRSRITEPAKPEDLRQPAAEQELFDNFAVGGEKKADKAKGYLAPAPVLQKDVVSAPVENETLVSGRVISEASGGVTQTIAAGASNQGISANRMEAAKRARPVESHTGPFFALHQRHWATGRTDADANEAGDVPALMSRSGDTLHVTVLLDSLLSTDEMKMAFVRQVAQDSIEVVFPYRTIGYKLPRQVAR